MGKKKSADGDELELTANKVRGGQAARIEAGFAQSLCPYGYRVLRGVVDDKRHNVNGLREIEPNEAAVVVRIFQEYANGASPTDIAAGLNEDKIAGPSGGPWRRSALLGSAKKAEGLLRNEAYIGNLVYHRTRVVRDPATGKRRVVPVPERNWVRTHVPALRIVDDDLWRKVQNRIRLRPAERKARAAARKRAKKPRILDCHNQHALTGWVLCAWCGKPKSIADASRYRCSANRYDKTCKNARGTKEWVLMAATFDALRDRIRTGPDFREAFARALKKNAANTGQLKGQADDISKRIERLMLAVERGIKAEFVTDRLLRLQEDLEQVRAKMQKREVPELPEEDKIRSSLLRAVGAIEQSGDVERQRILFKCVLEAVILTPIESQRAGERIDVKLNEDGWVEFWSLIAGTNS